MAKTHLKIISPKGIAIDELVDIVTVKTLTGYVGILPEHIPFVSTLVPGELSYRIDGIKKTLLLSGGVVQANQKFVKIITDEVQKTVNKN